MSANILAIQPQKDVTLLKELVTIGEKVPTTPKGGKHEHTDTITPQPIKMPSNTAESMVENSRKNPNTPKPRVKTTITPQPIKTPLNTVEPRVGNSRAKSQEPRAENQEPRPKSREPRAKSQELRTKS